MVIEKLLSTSLSGQSNPSLGFFIRLFKECMQTMKDKWHVPAFWSIVKLKGKADPAHDLRYMGE